MTNLSWADDQDANAHELYLSQLFQINHQNGASLAPYLLLGDGGHWYQTYQENDQDHLPVNYQGSSNTIKTNKAIGNIGHFINQTTLDTLNHPHRRYWGCIEPINLYETQNELLLTAASTAALSKENAKQLLLEAIPVFESWGFDVVAPTPYRWYISPKIKNSTGNDSNAISTTASVNIDTFKKCHTFSLSWVNGQHCEPYLPSEIYHSESTATPFIRKPQWWMKLQNEVQMRWQTLAQINSENSQNNFNANAFWLYGIGPTFNTQTTFQSVYTAQSLTRGLSLAAQLKPLSLPLCFDQIQLGNGKILIELDFFLNELAADHNKNQSLLACMTAIENDWLKPAISALKRKKITSISLSLTDNYQVMRRQHNRLHHWQFWKTKAWHQHLIDNYS